MSKLDSAALDEIEARANAATREPSTVSTGPMVCDICGRGESYIAEWTCIGDREHEPVHLSAYQARLVRLNAEDEFIAHAPEEIPALIAALRAYQAREAAIRELAGKWKAENSPGRAWESNVKEECAEELEQLLNTEPEASEANNGR